MLYMVHMTVHPPENMPEDKWKELVETERNYAQDLQRDGRWKHLWRLAGTYENYSVFDVEDHDELHEIITGLPLFNHLEFEVDALATHPSAIPESGEAMSFVHPETLAHLELQSERESINVEEMGLERARSVYDQRAWSDAAEPPPADTKEDVELKFGEHTVPARRFIPPGGGRAVLVYAHGGGWVFGSSDSYEPFAREVCCRALAETYLVDFRRAPEHRYPAAHDDIRVAVEAAYARKDPDVPLFVGGDSGGGLLALAAAHDLRETYDFAGQILLYPCLDPRVENASWDALGEYGLNADSMRWFWRQYLGEVPEDDAELAEISPLFREDLSGLPPTLLLAAGLDPLADEIDELQQRLEESDVDVSRVDISGVPHGFARLTKLYRMMSQVALDRIARFFMERTR